MALQKLPPPPKSDNAEMDRWLNSLYNNVNLLTNTNVVATINTTLAPTAAKPVATILADTIVLANDLRQRLIDLKISTGP